MVTLMASLFVFLALATGSIILVAPGSRRTASDERLRALRPTGGGEADHSAAATFRRPRSSIPTLQRLLSDSSWADKVAIELQQANVQLRVGEYLLVRVLLGALAAFLVVIFSSLHPIGVVLGVLAGVVAFMLPASYIRMARRRRVAKIEKQLIELSPMLASSLRSGFALQQGLELAQQQLGPPLADELGLLLHDINLGASMEGALQDFGERIGSTDLDMLITAILVQRATGGNLSEIFDQTAETLREREQIRGELNTLTAQQRLTGWVLSIYPTGIGLVLLALVPSIWSKLFTETAGLVLLGIAVGLQLLGVFFMRRLMDIKI